MSNDILQYLLLNKLIYVQLAYIFLAKFGHSVQNLQGILYEKFTSRNLKKRAKIASKHPWHVLLTAMTSARFLARGFILED